MGFSVEELSGEIKTETAVLPGILFQRLNKYSKTRKKVEQQKDHRRKDAGLVLLIQCLLVCNR